jgi:xanthine dehydrogenase large subunit
VPPCAQACVAAAKKLTDFETLEASVSAFNASSRYVKHGLALSPIRFAVQECTGFSAVVAVRSDATVVVQQSGTELGQGLYEKQAQCAAYSLNCPLHLVAVDGVTSKICTGAWRAARSPHLSSCSPHLSSCCPRLA